jgi:hypothetical protein
MDTEKDNPKAIRGEIGEILLWLLRDGDSDSLDSPYFSKLGDDFIVDGTMQGKTLDQATDQIMSLIRGIMVDEEGIAETLHNVGLDAYHDYKSMGQSGWHWNKFRQDLAHAISQHILERLGER